MKKLLCLLALVLSVAFVAPSFSLTSQQRTRCLRYECGGIIKDMKYYRQQIKMHDRMSRNRHKSASYRREHKSQADVARKRLKFYQRQFNSCKEQCR